MENKQKKCIKGASCLHCGSTYCQFVEEFNSLEEQIQLQRNFIDSLLEATNNSEWLDKSILDDEAGEIIEKIELDYAELDQLKTEVKSKTEYIQEQREIIDQYSKEIEMYKKCQGKRASKREEELKAENEELKNFHINLVGVKECEIKELLKLKATLAEIKEICNKESG